MRILEVYDKSDLGNLTCNGLNVLKTMNDFFSYFPCEYRRIYDINLKTLKAFYVDEHSEFVLSSGYNTHTNQILFSEKEDLGHEFMHMASYDKDKGVDAFSDKSDFFTVGLVEGMTEYLSMLAFNYQQPRNYCFEVFCVEMLREVGELFQSYFVPDHEKFISIFPNKRDIYSLMYSLSSYTRGIEEYIECLFSVDESVVDITLMSRAIRATIDSLIDIELSHEKDRKILKLYREKFMDFINCGILNETLSLFDDDISNYCYHRVREKIHM